MSKREYKSKYLGKIYDGYWEVIEIIYPYGDKQNQKYILKNIYNNKKLTIGASALKRVDEGLSTIGKTINNHIKRGISLKENK